MSGMCATGSWDFKVDDVFIPQDRALPFQSILDATSGISERFGGPLYRTPLMPVLGLLLGCPFWGGPVGALELCRANAGQAGEQDLALGHAATGRQ